MNTIDSTLLYALFNVKDQWHREAKRVMEENRPILVPPGILQETLDLLRYRHGAKTSVAALQWLARADKVILEARRGDGAFTSVLNEYANTGEAANGVFDATALSVADAWCISYAIANDAPLLTKDADQEKVFRALLDRRHT
ncbi:MAG: PIN domain-containing protein [Thermoplasmatota archaeon]